MNLLTQKDLEGFVEGRDARAFDKLGAHTDGDTTRFAVWAPNAHRVQVIGDWNAWQGDDLERLENTGVWQLVIRGKIRGQSYKYRVHGENGWVGEKSDPYGFLQEVAPGTSSVVWDLATHAWKDDAWRKRRKEKQTLDAPMAIYECHLGSWRRVPEEGNRSLGYREIAPLLADHVEKHGFTHIEFLPVAEHAFYGSWGYLTTG